MKYAWFSVGLPESTPSEVVKLLKSNGYHGVEWRVTQDTGDTSKPSFWNGNRSTLQDNWSDAQFKEVAKMTKDAGLQVPNLGSYAKSTSTETVKRMAEVAALFGAPSFRVNIANYDGKVSYKELLDTEIKALDGIVQYCKPLGVKPLIEIHMTTIAPSASAALRLLSNWTPAEIGVIHDVGNMVYEGFENYKMGLEILGKYLSHVHIKNAVNVYEPSNGLSSLKWKTVASPLRTGHADLSALATALRAVGYDGWLAVEDFSIGMSQQEKVADNIRVLKEMDGAL